MKLLVDACVSRLLAETLSARGHDVVWVGEWNDPAAQDSQLLAFAESEKRILITLDKDFGELAVAWAQPHCGIVRLLEMSPAHQVLACIAALGQHEQDLLAGAVLTVTQTRIRVRRP